jgi:peptide/nickel transport system substrate-binding protein
LPKHILEGYSDEELKVLDWFNHPDVVSGPFKVTEYHVNHFVSYDANMNYWKGAPKIEKLNFKIVDASQIYAGLKTGEIDLTHHAMTAIPQDDYENIEALEQLDVIYGVPVTNQSVFLQTANLTDARVRKAIVHAIDREMIVEKFLKGHGEVVDGFLSSASPYFDESMEPMAYDPELAKSLLQQAGWDSKKELKFLVNADDSAFVNAAQIMLQQWEAVGLKVKMQTLDLASLMSKAGSLEYDMLAVQYTYAPNDPYPDISWLLSGEGSWTGYQNAAIDKALAGTQTAKTESEIEGFYAEIGQKVQEDVPMFSAYILRAQGAVNKRLSGVKSNVYGMFNDIHLWEITE